LCCPTKSTEVGVGESCKTIAGTCLDSTVSSCATGFVKGQCPGSDKVLCCPNSASDSDDSKCLNIGGKCMNQSNCNGTVHSGLCSGGIERKCCLPPNTTCQGVGGVCNALNKRQFYDPLRTLFLDKLCPGNNKCCIPLIGPLTCQDLNGNKGVCVTENNCDKQKNTIYLNYALLEPPCTATTVCCIPKPESNGFECPTASNNNDTKSGKTKEEEAIPKIFDSEGGCQNDPNDSGNIIRDDDNNPIKDANGNNVIGYTCAGVSANVGWNSRDYFDYALSSCTSRADFVKCAYDLDSYKFKASTEKLYVDQYAKVGGCTNLPQPAYYVCFDMAVNQGQNWVASVTKNNPIGNMDGKEYSVLLNSISRDRYYNIVEEKPSNKRYLDSWLDRVSSRENYCDSYC
jgi:hypothetical protein